ncbi:10203_t:CDS:2 [Gigaspora margarita]|uniref:10203_t:CDS:1 n=1 Tax=Gigaspora margarita TaxID=4874 RepID=A0ABN7VXR8_GIGMA|nr:10203_t:CDS:2 [Gigaspora margarita]
MLPSESERCNRLDREYLKLVNLTNSEWQLLDKHICLLKLFYEATTIFSGLIYSIQNLIYPTIKLLIKREQINDDQNQLITNEEDSDKFDDEMPAISEKLRQLLHISQG